MKTIKYITSIFFIGAILTIGSCKEEFLEVADPNEFTTADINNAKGIRLVEIGLYNRLKGMYDYAFPLMLSSLAGEMYFHFSGGEGPMIQQWWNLNPPTKHEFGDGFYSGYYAWIYQANLLIEAHAKKPGELATMDQAELDKIAGAAYFVRGFAYFNLLHLFGRPHDKETGEYGALLVSDQKGREALQKPRSTVAETYAQIESDFKQARDLLPLEVNLGADEKGKIHRGAAMAFLGKTYLFQKKYTEAINELELFLQENPQKHLLPYYGDNFHGKFDNGPESIFEIQFSDLTTSVQWAGGGSGRAYQEFMAAFGLGRGNVLIPEPIMNRFKKYDIRKIESAFTAIRDTIIFMGKTIVHRDSIMAFESVAGKLIPIGRRPTSRNPLIKYAPKKYIERDRDRLNSNGIGVYQGTENEKIMRLAEVYFLLAEAYAEGPGDIAKAAFYQNKILRRAYGYPVDQASPYDYTGSDKNDFIQFMREDKAKEFIGESIRWYDIIRWDIVADEVALTGRVFTDRVRAMPIPAGELTTNLLMGQNPGYN